MSYRPDDVRAFTALKRTVDRRLHARVKAREAGDYETADTIRNELQADGWVVRDGKNGELHVSVPDTDLRWHYNHTVCSILFDKEFA